MSTTLIRRETYSNTYKAMQNDSSARRRAAQKKPYQPQQYISQYVTFDIETIKRMIKNNQKTSLPGTGDMKYHDAVEGGLAFTVKKGKSNSGDPEVICTASGLDVRKFFSAEEYYETINFLGIVTKNAHVLDTPGISKKIPEGEEDTMGRFAVQTWGTRDITNGPEDVTAGEYLVWELMGDWTDNSVDAKAYLKKYGLYKNSKRTDFVLRPYDPLKIKKIMLSMQHALLSTKMSGLKPRDMVPIVKYMGPRYLNGTSNSNYAKATFLQKAAHRAIIFNFLMTQCIKGTVKCHTVRSLKREMRVNRFLKELKNGTSPDVKQLQSDLDGIDAGNPVGLDNMKNVFFDRGSTNGLSTKDKQKLKLIENGNFKLLKKLVVGDDMADEIMNGVYVHATKLGLVRNPSKLNDDSDDVPKYFNRNWDDDLIRAGMFAQSKDDVLRETYTSLYKFTKKKQKASIERDMTFIVQNAIPLYYEFIVKVMRNYERRKIGKSLTNVKKNAKGCHFQFGN